MATPAESANPCCTRNPTWSVRITPASVATPRRAAAPSAPLPVLPPAIMILEIVTPSGSLCKKMATKTIRPSSGRTRNALAIASAFLVRPELGLMVFVAIFLHKLPEGVTISSIMMAGGRTGSGALGAAALLGVAPLAGVILTDQVGFLVQHGLALSAGVAIYVAASNLVPELQGKHGWTMPVAFFAGALVFFLTKVLLEAAT